MWLSGMGVCICVCTHLWHFDVGVGNCAGSVRDVWTYERMCTIYKVPVLFLM